MNTSQKNTPAKTDRISKDMSTSNPWEMLRDHFISLRERRLALENTSETKDES